MIQKMRDITKDTVTAAPSKSRYIVSDRNQDTTNNQRETYSKRETPKRERVGEKSRKRSVSFNYDTVRVEINTADTTELKRLRGIGSVLSARIVKYRGKIGGFTSVEQLRNIYGLSQETYEDILPHIWIK